MTILHLLEHDPEEFPDTNITRWAAAHGHEVVTANLSLGHRPLDPEKYDWLFVMGGSAHAYEDEKHAWLPGEKEYIRRVLDRGKPALGICFGAQLIAEALGGRVFANGQSEIGWHEVTLAPEAADHPVFRGLPPRFTTFHWHGDHFSLPEGAVRMAFSPPSPHQAYVVQGRPIVGLQFHPEYTREMVIDYAKGFGHEWTPGPWAPGQEKTIEQTSSITPTYWLMERLLDNLARYFQQPGP